VKLPPQDIEALFRKIDTSGDGKIEFDEFSAYLSQHAEFQAGPRKKQYAGSRPVGYAGHRRKQSIYDSTGMSSSCKVSTRVKEAVAQHVKTIAELFIKLDTNGDGIIQRQEMRDGLGAMNLGLNWDQIDAVHDEIAKSSEYGNIVRLEELQRWLKDVDLIRVTLPMTIATSPIKNPAQAWALSTSPQSYEREQRMSSPRNAAKRFARDQTGICGKQVAMRQANLFKVGAGVHSDDAPTNMGPMSPSRWTTTSQARSFQAYKDLTDSLRKESCLPSSVARKGGSNESPRSSPRQSKNLVRSSPSCRFSSTNVAKAAGSSSPSHVYSNELYAIANAMPGRRKAYSSSQHRLQSGSYGRLI
jgi:Ca2+-binding EF-hand superfamily protein